MSQEYPDTIEFAVDPSISVQSGTKTSSDGGKTWKDVPGPPIFARVYFIRSNSYLDSLLHDLPAPSVKNLRHKIKAVQYHKVRYLRAEEEEVKHIREMPPSQGIEAVIDDPEAIYDLEGFLFQVKSTLDVALLVLKNRLTGDVRKRIEGFNTSKVDGVDMAGQKTITALERYIEENPDGAENTQINEIVDVIVESQPWTTELVKMRDKVTHFARLDALWFVHEPYLVVGKRTVRFPRMPENVRDVRSAKYVSETWDRLDGFLRRYLDAVRSL